MLAKAACEGRCASKIGRLRKKSQGQTGKGASNKKKKKKKKSRLLCRHHWQPWSPFKTRATVTKKEEEVLAYCAADNAFFVTLKGAEETPLLKIAAGDSTSVRSHKKHIQDAALRRQRSEVTHAGDE